MTRRTASRRRCGPVTSGTALRVADAVRSGQFSVNTNWSVHLEAPFGGYKMSGLGRQLGMEVLDHYTQVKNVFIDLS